MKLLRFISAKLGYWYYGIILRFKYNMKPNKTGTYDLESQPATPNAHIMKCEDLRSMPPTPNAFMFKDK